MLGINEKEKNGPMVHPFSDGNSRLLFTIDYSNDGARLVRCRRPIEMFVEPRLPREHRHQRLDVESTQTCGLLHRATTACSTRCFTANSIQHQSINVLPYLFHEHNNNWLRGFGSHRGRNLPFPTVRATAYITG